MRYYLIRVIITIINKSTNNKHSKGCGRRGTLLLCWWECRLVQPLWKRVWRYLKKLKMDLPFIPAILLLGIYPREPKTPLWVFFTPVFIVTLFTIAEIWKQPKCPSLNEWIKHNYGKFTQWNTTHP